LTFNNIIGTSQDWVFANATMIDGATEQIQPNGSTTVGHSGNGYARVTFLSAS
jgi:hypothetical protein